ncbi:MAG: hypothetical protein FWG85_05115 [Bacteroidetes bacterium]|nr:hypothetical protein [Bacteroidota bacterium]
MTSFNQQTIKTILIALAIMFTASACSNNDSILEAQFPTDQQEQIKVLKSSDVLLGDVIEDADIGDFYQMLFDGYIKSMEYTWFEQCPIVEHHCVLLDQLGEGSKLIGINVHCNDDCKYIPVGRAYAILHRYVLNEELTTDDEVCFDAYEYPMGLVGTPQERPHIIRRYFFSKYQDGGVYQRVYYSESIGFGPEKGRYTELQRNCPEDRVFKVNGGVLHAYHCINFMPVDEIPENGELFNTELFSRWLKQTNGTFSFQLNNEEIRYDATLGYFIENVVIKK